MPEEERRDYKVTKLRDNSSDLSVPDGLLSVTSVKLGCFVRKT